MKKFVVTWEEMRRFSIEVDAESEDVAEDFVLNNEYDDIDVVEGDSYFGDIVEIREVKE